MGSTATSIYFLLSAAILETVSEHSVSKLCYRNVKTMIFRIEWDRMIFTPLDGSKCS
jgi:hypothetical protein